MSVFSSIRNSLITENKCLPDTGLTHEVAALSWGNISGRGILTIDDIEYEGSWTDGQLHGKGTMRWPDGSVYDGDWENGKRHGKGKMDWPDGRSYMGDWKNDKREGKGLMHWPLADPYTVGPTDLSAQDITTTNVLTFASAGVGEDPEAKRRFSTISVIAESAPIDNQNVEGARYFGDWKEGVRCGSGMMVWANKEAYNGEWKEDLRWGVGDHVSKNEWGQQLRYRGSFKEDRRCGKGVMAWSNGSSVDGEWSNDRINGSTTVIFASGGEYHGKIKENSFSGKGQRVFPNGSVYDGEWQEHQRHGKGSMFWPDGGIYQGQWNTGKRHGRGQMTWSDGRWYDGQWRDDKAPESGAIMPRSPTDSSPAMTPYGSPDSKRNDGPECIICMIAPRELLFEPCNHVSCCSQCSPDSRECPMCRTTITYEKRVFVG